MCYMELVLTLIVSDGYECIICSRFYVCHMELVLTLIVSDGYECVIRSRFYVCDMTGSYLDSQ